MDAGREPLTLTRLRLFAALPVDVSLWPDLVAVQKGLEGASWRPQENFHVTLRFFGELDHGLARDLDEELARIDAPGLRLRAQGVAWFGSREPYSVHAPVIGETEADTVALNRLAGACERAARRIGLPPEPRAFRPHVTLAYLHRTPLDAVGAYATRNAALRTGIWDAQVFHMYSSHETRGPTRYVAEADYPLGLRPET
jgi:2'-5' RNA ligase